MKIMRLIVRVVIKWSEFQLNQISLLNLLKLFVVLLTLILKTIGLSKVLALKKLETNNKEVVKSSNRDGLAKA